MEFFTKLFDSSDFPPRWNCGSWTDGHGWLHILSDLGIFSAYFAIPIVLLCFVARRKDLPFRGLFTLFGAFILLCGTTHLMEAIIFWWPGYRLAGLLKLATALVSWATVIALIPLVPKILAMRSPEELEREIELRKAAEAELQKTNAELEQRVLNRTRELTAAVAALEEERGLLRFVMDAMPQKIFTANPEGILNNFNPQWSDFTGLPFGTDEEREWSHFIHTDDLPPTIRLWHHSIATGEPFELEHRFRRGDGAYRWHITRAKAQKDRLGKVKMWVGSNTDINDQVETANELRSIAEQLSEADRRKDEFLATLAHELRNPLAPLRTGLHLMRQTNGARKGVDEARAMMERQLEQLIRLVDDLMDVSRISRGRIELRKGRVMLEEVIRSAVETCCPADEFCGHDLVINLPESPVLVHADLTRLAQVFTNLLNNAAKYSDPGSTIAITAQLDRGDVTVSVRDEGIGIEAFHLPRIFDMFTQLDRSIEKSRGGLGIGLSLVKRLVEMHEGTVEVRSDGAGKGAEFIVTLPTLSDPDTPAISLEKLDAPPAAGASLRILIVDDNRDSADCLSMMLDALCHVTLAAYDGEAALAAAESFSPEVVLLDIGLPGISGYEICRRLRQRPGGGDLVIFAQTGWGQDEDRRRTQEAGFDQHLVKPLDPADLLNRLREVGEKKQQAE